MPPTGGLAYSGGVSSRTTSCVVPPSTRTTTTSAVLPTGWRPDCHRAQPLHEYSSAREAEPVTRLRCLAQVPSSVPCVFSANASMSSDWYGFAKPAVKRPRPSATVSGAETGGRYLLRSPFRVEGGVPARGTSCAGWATPASARGPGVNQGQDRPRSAASGAPCAGRGPARSDQRSARPARHRSRRRPRGTPRLASGACGRSAPPGPGRTVPPSSPVATSKACTASAQAKRTSA